MKPPTKEEEAIAEEVVDEGWGRHLDGQDPFYIQTVLDALCRSVNSMEQDVQNNLEVYVSLGIDQIMNIRALERRLIVINPWASAASSSESISRA